MITTNELLDQVKDRHGIASDYKLAQVLMVAKSAVINYRKGVSHPDQMVCQRLAELLDLDPDLVVCSIQAERTKDENARSQWARIAARLEKAPAALAAVILSVLFSGGPDAGALAKSGDSAVVPTHVSSVDSLYIVANKLASILALLAFGLRRLNVRRCVVAPHFAALPNFA